MFFDEIFCTIYLVFQVDRKWRKLTGFCALQRGYEGSVRFRILGDGKELYNSGIVRNSEEQEINIDISRVSRLELVNDHGGDDKRNDWGVWLAPTLSR